MQQTITFMLNHASIAKKYYNFVIILTHKYYYYCHEVCLMNVFCEMLIQ